MIPPIAPELDPARRPCPSCAHPLGAVRKADVLVCERCLKPLPATSLGGGMRLGPGAPPLGSR